MRSAALLGCLYVAGCGGGAPTVERGQYLVDTIGACGFCHTPLAGGRPDASRKLGGVIDRFDLGPAGRQSAPNLTPDPSGLGDWSDAEVKRALREGIRKTGEVLWWTMPYYETANYTDEDLDSIVLYLRSLPPVKNPLPPRVPYTARATPYLPISGDALPRTTLPAGTLAHDRAQRGRYLASVGCLTCHTPLGSGEYRRDPARAYAGGGVFSAIPPYSTKEAAAKNLTSGANGTQLTVAELAATLTQSGTMLCGPMSFLVGNFFQGLTAEDATAIATYLRSLPPVDSDAFPDCAP